jgi:hypothetical protein
MLECHVSIRAFFLGLTFAAAAGCSHLPFRGGNNPAVDIEVKNDVQPRENLAVYITLEPNDRRYLGDVPPGQTKTFSYRPRSYVGNFHLTARAPLQSEIVSHSFTLDSETVVAVEWQVGPNMVSFRSPSKE